ncbi:TPA: TetR/AcrR family transcriptional regulator [Candidatus Sumerlaeota bacterium]|nr:TetR/AcrR family transcriptional regulator [Candidatus Sumerlaeota bacterium]
MTLDAVAERAGVSKGGLMYNFPTKEALLTAMITRLGTEGDKLREQERAKFPAGQADELFVEISMFAHLSGNDFRRHAALLAVIATRPELMCSFRDVHKKRMFEDILAHKDPVRAAILFFAALGLHFDELLGISFMDVEQRKKVYERLLRLVVTEDKM